MKRSLCQWLMPPVLVGVVSLVTSGCASSLLNLSAPSEFGSKLKEMMSKERPRLIDKEDDNDFDTRLETPLLRDYVSVTGNNMIALRGVGLVTGLDGTGGDPPPSSHRKQLLDDMRRRKIPNPGAILARRDTALVLVTAYLPAMVREGQRFDVRVMLPPNSEATSLKGGWLLETRLSEEQTIAGKGNLKGHEYAIGNGAILTALGSGGSTRDAPAMLRRGSIPGGAVSKTSRDLEIILRNDHRGIKASRQIERVISERLHDYNNYGQRIPMAESKTDIMLELKVHPTYRNNFPRYQQMIRSLALRESDVSRRLRMEKLARELLIPEKAAASALQLEAIGRDAVAVLKTALLSESLEVRFHAAQALAYLKDSSGVDVLKQAAEQEPAFRVYALAALSVVTEADGVMALRELLSDDELEVRYGAVRALKENNPGDHSLGTTAFDNRFILHAIESSGPAAVHVVRYRSPEVVVFGKHQELRLPAVLNVGNRIRVMGKAGSSEVTVTKYVLNKEPVRRRCSVNLVDIIETLADMGANYPDIVQMMLEAEKQHNLEGELGIDRLPQAGRVFSRGFGEETRSAKLGTESLTPGLFDTVDDDERERELSDDTALDRLLSDPQDDLRSLGDSGDSALPFDDDEMIDMPDIDEEIPAGFGPSESFDADDEPGEFVPEETEFAEPVGARLKRFFRVPFGKSE
ncbi:MAG: flagellar basal body P-ring protein FlgI [Planctomycetaceae bacterium]|nr:flagellar basal body P-ring protein FlgI [Planctomycetaceae bacterium]